MQVTSTAPRRTVVSIIIAAFMVIAGILTFCGSLALVGLGGLAGSLGSIASVTSSNLSAADAATAQQAQDALNQVQSSSGLLVVLGILLMIIGIAYLVTGIGLFLVRRWAYNATIVISVLYIIVDVVEAIVNHSFGLGTLVVPVIALIVLVFFLTNEDTKRAFGRI